MKKLLMFCILSLCSCANLGEKFQTQPIPENDAVVYFYRPWKYVGGGVSPDIQEDGKTIVTMYNGGYYPHYVSEGKHIYTVESFENKDSITIDALAGHEYYVTTGINFGVLTGRYNIKLVSDKQRAISEIKECKLIKKE